MLTSLLTQLIQIINTQTTFILFLLAQLAKLTAYSKKPHVTSIDSLDYQKLVVDDLPIVVEIEKLDYRLLLQQHLDQTGKAIKPVHRRKNSLPVPNDILCPKCQTPHDYLYNNNGGKGQFHCKNCQTNFKKNRFYVALIAKKP